MQSSKLGMCMGYHLSMKGIQKGYLFCQKWFMDLVAEPPLIKLY